MDRRKYDGGEETPGEAGKDGHAVNGHTSSSKAAQNSEPPAELLNVKISGKWVLGKKLGSGAFGDIYIGHNVLTEGKVAIKVENKRNPHPQLEHEAKVYKYLTGTRKETT